MVSALGNADNSTCRCIKTQSAFLLVPQEAYLVERTLHSGAGALAREVFILCPRGSCQLFIIDLTPHFNFFSHRTVTSNRNLIAR